MGFLDRESILSSNDLPREIVEVPEWGGSIILRVLTAAERDKFEASMGTEDDRNIANLRARLVGLCAIEESGAKLFPDDAAIAKLGGKSSAILTRLFDVCKRLNKMGEDEAEKALGN